RHRGGAKLRAGPVGREQLERVRKDSRDAIPAADAKRGKRVCPPIDEIVELQISEAFVANHNCGGRRPGTCMPRERAAKRKRSRSHWRIHIALPSPAYLVDCCRILAGRGKSASVRLDNVCSMPDLPPKRLITAYPTSATTRHRPSFNPSSARDLSTLPWL